MVLRKNRIKDDDLADLGDALQNSELENLDLSENRDLTKNGIDDLVKKVPSLKKVQIQGTSANINDFEPQVQSILAVKY